MTIPASAIENAAPPRRFAVPPFAAPAAGVATMSTARRWDAGPFVPAPWRTAASPRLLAAPFITPPAVMATATPAADLPSITHFLATTPSPSAAAPPIATPAAFLQAFETVAGDIGGRPVTPARSLSSGRGVGAVAAGASDEWPLADAVHALDALSRGLRDTGDGAASPARLFSRLTPSTALPAWTDEDLPHVQPAAPPVAGAVPAKEATPDPAAQAASARAAAQALEQLAQRARNGELALPGYDPSMGDAAALVSALAGLLGMRVR